MKNKKWIVDECPDANGHWTIRYDNGTPNGDTDKQPLATVFDWVVAELIVQEHNCLLEKFEK